MFHIPFLADLAQLILLLYAKLHKNETLITQELKAQIISILEIILLKEILALVTLLGR